MREDPFAGSWQVLEATLPNGKPGYTGSIEIRRNGSTYDLEWSISDGSYVGVGIERGGNLLVACGPQRAGLGLAFFSFDGERTRALWTVPELQGAIGVGELLSPWSGSFEGTHSLRQLLPDGSERGRFAVEMKLVGEVYEITWSQGGAVLYRGVGFAASGGLVAAWYPDPGQLALLDYAVADGDPDALQGRWALGGFPALATEQLKRRTDRGTPIARIEPADRQRVAKPFKHRRILPAYQDLLDSGALQDGTDSTQMIAEDRDDR